MASREREGSTFRIELPLTQDGPGEATAEPERAVPQREEFAGCDLSQMGLVPIRTAPLVFGFSTKLVLARKFHLSRQLG